MTPFSLFYGPLRVMLGDNDPYQVYQFQDSALDQALRTVFLFGRQPKGFELQGDREVATEITPDLPSGNEFALVTLEAGMLLMGGDAGANSYRTRPLSVTTSGDRKRDLLAKMRTEIYAIVAGDGFNTYESFCVWLQGEFERFVYEAIPPRAI